jgi:hypothetical protein
MTEDNWVALGVGLLQVLAVVGAGIGAVFIDRKLQKEREEKSRKLWILKTLMATRGLGLSAEHINALNLIDFEFYNSQDVRTAWKTMLTHLGDSTHIGTTDWAVRRQDLLTDLIVKMAAHLGYKYEHVDLKSSSYLPNR